MKEQPVWFIEQFRYINRPDGQIINSPCNPIEKMGASLERTHNALVLKTVAVFKIKLKPGVMIAEYHEDLKATIIL